MDTSTALLCRKCCEAQLSSSGDKGLSGSKGRRVKEVQAGRGDGASRNLARSDSWCMYGGVVRSTRQAFGARLNTPPASGRVFAQMQPDACVHRQLGKSNYIHHGTE